MNIVSALNYAEHNKGCVFLPIWNGYRNGNLQYVHFKDGHFVMNFNGNDHAWIPSWIDIRSYKWDVITKTEIEAYELYSDIVGPALKDLSKIKYNPDWAKDVQSDDSPNLEELLDNDIVIDVEHIEEAAQLEAASHDKKKD